MNFVNGLEKLTIRWFIYYERVGKNQARANHCTFGVTGASAELTSPEAWNAGLSHQPFCQCQPQSGFAVNKRIRKITRPVPAQVKRTAKSAPPTPVPFTRYSQANLDRLARNLEQGIRDLPVWKDLVARVGLQAARKRLRQGMFMNMITDGNLGN